MIWGNPLELNHLTNQTFILKEKFLKNRMIISAYELKAEKVDDYIDKINQYKPEYFYGYATALYTFAKLMISTQRQLSCIPKAVVSTAETLHSHQRETIKQAFKCDVVNEYGARDGGIIAYECPHGHMHISSENLILEVVDNDYNSLPIGDTGNILVTDLNNFVMPRLRYRLGDRGACAHALCKCGLQLPVLKHIDGREDDMFILLDGTLLHGNAFGQLARETHSIKQFQITQIDRTSARLLIVKAHTVIPDEIEAYISSVKRLLPDIQVTTEFVDSIPPTGSGKIRYAIRNFKI